MSKVALSGNASGTGTFTIASPNSNSDRTLTLPDNTGTLITTASTFAGTGPAFSAAQTTSQTFSSATITKVTLNSEEFDTNNCFDSTTNYRYTPTVAGYYQFNFAALPPSASRAGEVQIILYRNGGAFKSGNDIQSTASIILTGSALGYANGTTDYFELYLYVQTGGTVTGVGLQTYFQGFLARAA